MAAFALACVLVERVLPPREMPWLVQEKLWHLAAHGEDYNTLFLGSSRVENNIMPSVFDHDVSGQGVAIKSFNFGISAMYPPQDAFVLDQILDLKLKHIRWVFIELQTLQTTLPRANRGTLQQVYWHDWPRFALLCERFITTRRQRHWRDRFEEISERVPDFSDHILLFARYMTNLGRGSVLVNRWISHEPSPHPSTYFEKDHDGWEEAGLGHVMDRYEIAALESDLAKRRKELPVKESADPVSQKALDLMIAKIQRAGATPVLFVPPSARGTYFSPDTQHARNVIVLNFCQPQKYPELYLTKNRVDPYHLNAAGAEILTHLLATRFVEDVARK